MRDEKILLRRKLKIINVYHAAISLLPFDRSHRVMFYVIVLVLPNKKIFSLLTYFSTELSIGILNKLMQFCPKHTNGTEAAPHTSYRDPNMTALWLQLHYASGDRAPLAIVPHFRLKSCQIDKKLLDSLGSHHWLPRNHKVFMALLCSHTSMSLLMSTGFANKKKMAVLVKMITMATHHKHATATWWWRGRQVINF